MHNFRILRSGYMMDLEKKILVVDDAPEVLAWLDAILTRDGWTVFTAPDGESAKSLLGAQTFQLVITDWVMPNTDGLALIDWIRQRGESRYIYIILMTARGTEADSIEGLSSGADDYLVKPSSVGLLRARLKAASRIIKMHNTMLEQQERVRESRDLMARAYETVQSELHQAARHQRASLPGRLCLPDGIEADLRFYPASNLSGDHLDFFRVANDKLAFYLLDVSGHGVSAALRSAALSELLRPISSVMCDLIHIGPHSVLDRLNRHMCESSDEVEYLATLIIGVLDTRTGVVEIASAGHPCPVIMSREGRLRNVATSGLPLGVMTDTPFTTNQTRLQPGDTLLLFSDGVTDCQNEQEEQFGSTRLRQSLRQAGMGTPTQLVSCLDETLCDWRGSRHLEDDATLLAIGMTLDAAPTIVTEARPRLASNGGMF